MACPCLAGCRCFNHRRLTRSRARLSCNKTSGLVLVAYQMASLLNSPPYLFEPLKSDGCSTPSARSAHKHALGALTSAHISAGERVNRPDQTNPNVAPFVVNYSSA